MDASTPGPSHSVYHSAASSASSAYHTPRSSLDRDVIEPTIRPTTVTIPLRFDQAFEAQIEAAALPSTPLLASYEANTSYAVAARSMGSRSSTATTTDMPIATRLRKRRISTQSSIQTNSPSAKAMFPARTVPESTLRKHTKPRESIPNRTAARPSSPLIRTNLLRYVSPHSSSYAKSLQNAVDQVVASLMQRGRTREGHGLRELYLQSFKDPGTAVLLDALLRLRASERQRWDFARFVEDVNKLGNAVPVVVIEMPAKVEHLNSCDFLEASEVDCNFSEEHGVASQDPALSDTLDIQSSETETGLENQETISADKGQSPRPRPSVSASNAAEAEAETEAEAEEAASRDLIIANAHIISRLSPVHSILVSRYREGREILQSRDYLTASARALESASRSTEQTAASLRRDQKLRRYLQLGKLEPSEVVGSKTKTVMPTSWSSTALWKPLQDLQHRQQARRKKRKNRMFLSANGPVYFKNLLDVHLLKHGVY